MGNLVEKIYRFMQGRYGMDELGKALSAIGFGLWIISLVFSIVGSFVLPLRFVYPFLHLLWVACYGYMAFRALSRNIPKRIRENERWLKIRDKIFPFIDRAKKRTRDAQDNARRKAAERSSGGTKVHDAKFTDVGGEERIIRICPDCSAKLRLKKIQGTHNTVCPKCGCKFSVKVF